MVMNYSLRRVYNLENVEDFMASLYLYNKQKAIDTKKAAPVLAVQGQVEFLGNYKELFDDEGEQPVPIWLALAWILKDYGLSRTGNVATNLVYNQISGSWTFEPPLAVHVHYQFCQCARRHNGHPMQP